MTTHDNTGFVLNLLKTHAGFNWLMRFFSNMQDVIESGALDEESARMQFKERVMASKPTSFLGNPIEPETIDWPRLYDECRQLTEPVA